MQTSVDPSVEMREGCFLFLSAATGEVKYQETIPSSRSTEITKSSYIWTQYTIWKTFGIFFETMDNGE